MKNTFLIIILIILLLLTIYNYVSIGFKNIIFNSYCKFYFKILGQYDENCFIKILNSFELFDYHLNSYNILCKNNIGIKSYLITNNTNDFKNNKNKIIQFNIINFNDHHILNVYFNHKLIDLFCVFNIINKYTNKDYTLIPLHITKQIKFSYLKFLNLINNNYYYKHKTDDTLLLDKKIVKNQKQNCKTYVSTADIIISNIAQYYFNLTKKNNCNFIIFKKSRNIKTKNYFGNGFDPHVINIINNKNIPEQIRKSYKNNIFFLYGQIDGIINIRLSPFKNDKIIKIDEGEYELNEETLINQHFTNVPLHSIIYMDETNYIINLSIDKN